MENFFVKTIHRSAKADEQGGKEAHGKPGMELIKLYGVVRKSRPAIEHRRTVFAPYNELSQAEVVREKGKGKPVLWGAFARPSEDDSFTANESEIVSALRF